MKKVALWMLLAMTSVSYAADAEAFRCLEGAQESSPYKPENIIRWCEMEKDGRPLYHGSVWRWHQNHQMESKEFYVHGDAEGEWSSWYENGKPASLGTFKNGRKTGPWKYWDADGWLKEEVTYIASGNLFAAYYPTGHKKSTGQTLLGGKIGLWTYWDADGKEKAQCDFGNGLFSLPSESCQTIAKELEPKGFSLPVPMITTTPDAKAVLSIASETYPFAIPPGWVADTKAGKDENVALALYPTGGSWRGTGPNIYIRVLYKKGASFHSAVEKELHVLEADIAAYTAKTTKRSKVHNGIETLSMTMSYQSLIQTDSIFSIVSKKTMHETINYLDVSKQVIIMVALAGHSKAQRKAATPALMSLLASFRAEKEVDDPSRHLTHSVSAPRAGELKR